MAYAVNGEKAVPLQSDYWGRGLESPVGVV